MFTYMYCSIILPYQEKSTTDYNTQKKKKEEEEEKKYTVMYTSCIIREVNKKKTELPYVSY